MSVTPKPSQLHRCLGKALTSGWSDPSAGSRRAIRTWIGKLVGFAPKASTLVKEIFRGTCVTSARYRATPTSRARPTRVEANGAIDAQFYPNGIEGWMVKLDANPNGGVDFDRKFFVKWPAPHRPHQVRLEGGDCSSDSYCYP